MQHASLILLLCAPLSLAWSAITGTAAAQSAGDVVGSAEVARNGVFLAIDSRRDPLSVGGNVLFGGRILTDEEGVNVNRMADGSVLSVAPSSEVVIDRHVYSAGGDGEASARLLRGVLRLATSPASSGDLRIETPVATLGTRGTVFVVAHSASAGTIVIVEEGSVEFANRVGDSVIVPAGFASTISTAGSPPTDPTPPGAPAQAAVADLNTALAVIGQSPLGNSGTTGRLATMATAARAAAASVAPTDGIENFGDVWPREGAEDGQNEPAAPRREDGGGGGGGGGSGGI